MHKGIVDNLSCWYVKIPNFTDLSTAYVDNNGFYRRNNHPDVTFITDQGLIREYEGNNSNNHGADGVLLIDGGGGDIATLLARDVSRIPQEATIESSTNSVPMRSREGGNPADHQRLSVTYCVTPDTTAPTAPGNL